jgi:hypothetical protein
MDDTHQPNNPSHSKISLPTIARSIPGEIAASTRTSFTRVDHGTRPGTATGDNNHPDEAVLDDGGADAGVPPPEDVQQQQEEETGAPAAVPQVPQTLVQFLLVSGRRRSMAFDPETTVGRVKELLWNTWPNGTSTSPPPTTSPPSHMGIPEGVVPHPARRPDPTFFIYFFDY